MARQDTATTLSSMPAIRPTDDHDMTSLRAGRATARSRIAWLGVSRDTMVCIVAWGGLCVAIRAAI